MSQTSVIVDVSLKTDIFLSMHFAYKDNRTGDYVLLYDCSMAFNSKVLAQQINLQDEIYTIHYKLFMSFIDLALNNTCSLLNMQYPNISLGRENLSAFDACELYDSMKVIITNGTQIIGRPS